MVFTAGTPYFEFFADQLRWLANLAANAPEPWLSKGLAVQPLDEHDRH